MNLPPLSMWLAIDSPDRRPVRLWLPLFLVWLLLLPLVVLALVGTVLADLVLAIAGQRYHHYTLLLLGCCEAVGDARGMVVRIESNGSNVDMMFH